MVGALFGLATGAQAAYTINAVGVYDASTNVNEVDVSATTTSGSYISLTDFKALITSTYSQGLSGVVNFDAGTSAGTSVSPMQTSSTDYLTVNYGIGHSKALNIRNSTTSDFIFSNNTSERTPISGAYYLGKSGTLASGITANTANNAALSHFGFEFNLVDRITAVGGTLLGRDGQSGNVTSSITISNGVTTSTISQSHNQPAGNGTADTFFGFQLTGTQIADGYYITNLTFANSYRGFDDLAFVTAPEPSKVLLMMGALGALYFRRRR